MPLTIDDNFFKIAINVIAGFKFFKLFLRNLIMFEGGIIVFVLTKWIFLI
jgi:hypothetical protein